MFSGGFWVNHFRREFTPQLRVILEVLERRLLPGFADIEQEAEKVSEEVWEAFMSATATGEEDPGEFAEAAEQAGVSHYLLLDGIRQGMMNLFAAAIYHAFEQQVMLFLRKEVLHPSEENDPSLFSLSELRNRLRAHGLDIAALPSWSKVDELRLVANTVKHAEGRSAQELHNKRPDLFQHPLIVGMPFARQSARVFQPLVGEDLYVPLEDVRKYCDSVVQFWNELGSALEHA